jgi:hypothetical protein
MGFGRHLRLRLLTLLVAFGIGLVAQVVASVAMPMPMGMPQAQAAVAHATANVGGCPSCPKQRDVPGSPAMTPNCAAAFCAALPAVLPPGPVVAPRDRADFAPIVLSAAVGLTIPPVLGPPRPFHLT